VRAESFVAEADVDHQDAAAAIHVTLEPRSPSYARVELRLGGECPGGARGLVADLSTAGGRRVACVPAEAAEALRQEREALVDRAPFYARADEIAELRLEVTGPTGHVLDLARRGRGWHERAPEDADLVGPDGDAASALADRLAALRATTVQPAVPGAQPAAVAKATVVRVDGTTETVEVGPPSAAGVVAIHRDDDGATLSVSATDARDLLSPSLR
jgi:hypothetical protein